MKKIFTLAALFILSLTASAEDRSWNFTEWSDSTYANLLADSTYWSDIEKATSTEPTETSAESVFWQVDADGNVNDDGYLTANGEVIAELEGLVYTGTTDRSLAIAVNYPTALSTYEGGAYLWLGSKNVNYFTIPSVAAGSTIAMGVESHKTSDARGVNLVIDGTTVVTWEPTTYTEYSETLSTLVESDVVIQNTNGCHLYYITVTEPVADIALSYVTPEEDALEESLNTFTIGVDAEGWSINDSLVASVEAYTRNGSIYTVSSVAKSDEGNLVVALEDTITDEGTVVVVSIPEGLVYTSGHKNAGSAFYYEAGVEYEFTLDPADGATLTQIDSIKVSAEAATNVSTNWNYFSGDVIITDAEGNTTSITATYEPFDYETWTGYNYLYLILDEPIVAAGTYTLTIPAGAIYVNDAATSNLEAITATYTVDGSLDVTEEETNYVKTEYTVWLDGTTLNVDSEADEETGASAKNAFWGSAEQGTEGFGIQITGNLTKTLNRQSTITVDEVSHTSIKCSNKAENTLWFPSDAYVTNVTIYATANSSEETISGCYWASFNGVSYTEDDNDYNTNDPEDPGIASFSLNDATGGVTFKNAGTQPFFIIKVSYYTLTEATDTETGISTVATVTVDNDAVYSLSGVRVDATNLSKGIYIKNGKKFIVK